MRTTVQTGLPPAILWIDQLIKFKMCNLKSITIFIHLCCIACVPAKDCEPILKLTNWESNGSEPPAYLRLGVPPEVATALEAQIEDVRENLTLSLLANPFISDGTKCPPANSSYHDLRKFHTSHNIIKGPDKSQSLFFGKIFTGCYYVEMANAEGKKWLWDPIFVNTSYHYYDTMLKCKKFEVKAENYERHLKVELKIPLTCLQVRCRLLELSKITETAIADLISGNTRVSQDCLVQNIGNGKLPHVSCSKPVTGQTGFTLSAIRVVEKNEREGWGTVITWDFLNKDGASYYALFEQHNNNCNISYGDLMTWQPLVNFAWISYGFQNRTSTETFGYTTASLTSSTL